MVAVAQWLEHLPVEQTVGRSNRLSHPINMEYNEETIAKVEKLVKPTYAQLNIWAHGWLHIKNVVKAARELAQMEGANAFLCQVAAYCHDLGRLEEEKKGLVDSRPGILSPHGGFGVMPTREVLRKVGITGEDARTVVEAVGIHNIRKYEGKNEIALILQDADRSDGFGKLAILRFAVFNCAIKMSEPKSQDEIDSEFERVKKVLRKNKDYRSRMIATLKNVFEWVDDLANTSSLKKYVGHGYDFNKKFLEDIEKY